MSHRQAKRARVMERRWEKKERPWHELWQCLQREQDAWRKNFEEMMRDRPAHAAAGSW